MKWFRKLMARFGYIFVPYPHPEIRRNVCCVCGETTGITDSGCQQLILEDGTSLLVHDKCWSLLLKAKLLRAK